MAFSGRRGCIFHLIQFHTPCALFLIVLDQAYIPILKYEILVIQTFDLAILKVQDYFMYYNLLSFG